MKHLFKHFIFAVVLLNIITMNILYAEMSKTEAVQKMILAREKQFARAKHGLTVLYDEYLAYLRVKTGKFKPKTPLYRIKDDTVVIDAVAVNDSDILKEQLESLGMKQAVIYGNVVSGLLPIEAIKDMDALKSLQFARPSYAITSSGRVDSQGDIAMKSDLARSRYGIDGTGNTIGVLSDSFNCLGGAVNDVRNDDLHDEITILEEEFGCFSGSDEGRAMMQIIHDIAPGASLAFHTAYNGMADFAIGIIELKTEAGANIIVDDVQYFAEPMFQDGIIAQAVDIVKDLGAAYFSAAGNSGRDAYESLFQPSGEASVFFGEPHDFDPGVDTDTFQSVTIPEGTEVYIVLQWDSPFYSVSPPGSRNDVDIFLTNDPATTVLAYGIDNNIGSDPVETLYYYNPIGSGNTNFNIVIENTRGPAPKLIKYVLFNFEGTINEYDTESGTLYGHANAAGALAVGAAAYYETPEFGVDPAQLEYYSSAGPTVVIFDENGAFSAPKARKKPEIVSIDGVNTTFFGTDTETDGFPNFFGTSAAAPHAAAVAALMLEANPLLSPDDIYSILKDTALDMEDSGFDYDSGYGLIQADRAVEEALLR
ncbi:MAG: S8 family serine peptidase [Candidatus Kuenenia sp.]|nr:S8 family serine peptidase [Candidatus Kuenenia hertensis]